MILNRYYSNEIDSHETLPLLDSSESEVGFSSQDHDHISLPHSIIRGEII